MAKNPLSDHIRKIQDIKQACREHDVDRLIELASTTGGLVLDELRQQAWPLLLGSRKDDGHLERIDSDDWQSLPPHKDEDQVALDVNRAFVYYPDSTARCGDEGNSHGEDDEKKCHDENDEITDVVKTRLKALLNDLIVSTLRQHPLLNYFQGYHDIAQVLLLVYHNSSQPNDTVSFAAGPLARLSLLRIRDFMLPTISGTTSHLDLLAPILSAADPSLFATLSASSLSSSPFFALSSTLTMYAHDIQSYESIARIFDFLMASEAVMSVYMYASIILVQKPVLLDALNDDNDPAVLYAILSHLPQDLDLEVLVTNTRDLYAAHPPRALGPLWTQVSGYSVLKTTRSVPGLRTQTLGDGETWMELHAQEIQRLEVRREEEKRLRELVMRYAGPVSVGLAVAALVAGIAVVLGRRTGVSGANAGFTAFGWVYSLLRG